MTDPDVAPRRRFAFRLVWLAPVLALVALLSWVFASPVGASPDDDFHLTSIWCADDDRPDLCLEGDSAAERVVPIGVAYATCFVGSAEESAACQERFFSESQAPSIETARGNFLNNYPPVYYRTMNVFATPDVQTAALVMRVVNVVLFVAITVALWILLPLTRRRILLGMWLITSVPLGVFIIASNNPSSWAVTGVGASWLAVLGFLESHGWRRIALGVLAVLTTVMAAGARGDAALYVVLGFGIAGVIAFRRERSYFLSLILPVVLAIVGVVFYLSSQQSGVATSGLGTGYEPEVPPDMTGLLFTNLAGVPTIWAGVFGTWGLGWLDTEMPPLVWVASLVTFAGVLFVAISRVPARVGVMLVGLLAVLWLLPTYVLTRGYNVAGENVQPRYLLPLIVLLAGVALVAWASGRWDIRFGRSHAIVAATLLSGAHLLALNLDIRRYVTGSDVQGANLDAGAEWWWSGFPLPATAVWIIGSLAFAGLCFVLVREMTKIDVPPAEVERLEQKESAGVVEPA